MHAAIGGGDCWLCLLVEEEDLDLDLDLEEMKEGRKEEGE